MDPGFPDEYPSLLITNSRVVAELETKGLAFGDVVGALAPDARRHRDYAEESAKVLSTRAPIYADLVGALSRELSASKASTPNAGVGGAFQHRLFDPAWLTSEQVHFELVGVVNRMDFRGLLRPGCGQTRLVYRLALRPANRPETWLPMTVNVEYENHDRPCDELAREWLSLEQGDHASLAERLRAGPLAGLDLRGFAHVEVNLQSMRENSRERGMDDHAEYLLRSFDVKDAHLEAGTLRNTPDIEMGPEERDDLWTWVTEHLEGIEAGTAEVPARFLATRASSVTSRGLSPPRQPTFQAALPRRRGRVRRSRVRWKARSHVSGCARPPPRRE